MALRSWSSASASASLPMPMPGVAQGGAHPAFLKRLAGEALGDLVLRPLPHVKHRRVRPAGSIRRGSGEDVALQEFIDRSRQRLVAAGIDQGPAQLPAGQADADQADDQQRDANPGQRVTLQALAISTFAGCRSLCSTPTAWASASNSAHCAARSSRNSSAIAAKPPRAPAHSSRLPLAMYSLAKKRRLGVE